MCPLAALQPAAAMGQATSSYTDQLGLDAGRLANEVTDRGVPVELYVTVSDIFYVPCLHNTTLIDICCWMLTSDAVNSNTRLQDG